MKAGGDPVLATRLVRLASGQRVGVTLCGSGVPLVVVHGFGGEALLYRDTLSRLVEAGYQVVALDAPGHGRSCALPLGATFEQYRDLLGVTLDALGIGPAILVGHSMGGRVVCELAADQPERALAVVLVDAIVGERWDRMVELFRLVPVLYLGFGMGLLADTASIAARLDDPAQSVRSAGLLGRSALHHLRRPWRMAGPALTVVQAPPSDPLLRRLARHGLATFVVHGDRDVMVPLSTARAAADALGAHLVTVRGAGHSWMLSDPGAFPAVLESLGSCGLHGPGQGTLERPTPAGAGAGPASSGRGSRHRWTVTAPSAPLVGGATLPGREI